MAQIINIVGNLVKIPPRNMLSKHNNDNCIVFVGKMSYEPNIIAVTYFCQEIFPTLKQLYPELKFYIVGANPSKSIYKLNNISGVHVTGYVESVESYYQKATLVIAPMLTGAGIQNKIIQAMSYGCCVLTTPIGAEGLTIDNEQLIILNSAKEWIKTIQNLLINRTRRKEIGKKAHEYITNNLSKDVIRMQFWNFIDSAIQQNNRKLKPRNQRN